MSDARNIWVGDWKSQLKAQNKLLSSSAGRMSDIEKQRWNNYNVVGQNIYKQVFPTSYVAQDKIDGGAFYANTQILKDRAAGVSASTASSSSSAAKAASEAAKKRAAYEKALESAKSSSYSAGQAAAKAAAARAEYEKTHPEEVDQSIKASSASASKAASEAAKARTEWETRQAAASAARVADQERKAKLRQQEIDDLNAKLLEAQAKAEQAQIDAAKAEARASQYESSYTSSTPYYDYTDTNAVTTTTETAPADNTGRNVLIFCGLGLGAWWLLRRRKRRGRRV